MKKLILSFATISVIFFSCEKKEEPLPDLTVNLVGTYTGDFTTDSPLTGIVTSTRSVIFEKASEQVIEVKPGGVNPRSFLIGITGTAAAPTLTLIKRDGVTGHAGIGTPTYNAAAKRITYKLRIEGLAPYTEEFSGVKP